MHALLQVLNLQANRISDLKQVKKLGELPKLKKLSLFGNPIEEKKHYRSYVITVCPLVGQLGFPCDEPGARHRGRVGFYFQKEAEPGREGGAVSRFPVSSRRA